MSYASSQQLIFRDLRAFRDRKRPQDTVTKLVTPYLDRTIWTDFWGLVHHLQGCGQERKVCNVCILCISLSGRHFHFLYNDNFQQNRNTSPLGLFSFPPIQLLPSDNFMRRHPFKSAQLMLRQCSIRFDIRGIPRSDKHSIGRKRK